MQDGKEEEWKEQKSQQFELFRVYYTDQEGDRRLTYDDLAARFGFKPHEVKNRLSELHARFRRIVLSYLRDGVSSEEELIAEVREVFGA